MSWKTLEKSTSAVSEKTLDREKLENVLGFKVLEFPGKYIDAMTTKESATVTGSKSQERLEYLGDSVINFVTAKFLFDAYPAEQEGFLSIIRTRLTRSDMLANLAGKLGLGSYIIVGNVQFEAGYHVSKKALEDTLEALVGAVYLDCGFAIARDFFLRLIRDHVDMRVLIETNSNYKDTLMRVCHRHKIPLPRYATERTENGGCKSTTLVNGIVGVGFDYVKKTAEQIAAKTVLDCMGVPYDFK